MKWKALVCVVLLGGCDDASAPIAETDTEGTAETSGSTGDVTTSDASSSGAGASTGTSSDETTGGPSDDASAGESTGEPVDDDGVSVFVAMGWGGRRIISCDEGRTWINDHQDSVEDDWHQSYSPKGLAYHDGLFAVLTGWGMPGIVRTSRDGIDWQETSLPSSYGGIGFDGDQVVIMGGGANLFSVDDGATWTEHDSPLPPVGRDTMSFGSVWLGAGDGQLYVRVGEADWQLVGGCPGDVGGIGERGGFARGGGRLLVVGGDQTTCAIDEVSGEFLGAGSFGDPIEFEGKPAFIGGEFWAANGTTLHTSGDGVTWTARSLPVPLSLFAQSTAGTIVGIHGDAFHYSDDGRTWQEAAAPLGNGIVRLVHGRAIASEQCPAD